MNELSDNLKSDGAAVILKDGQHFPPHQTPAPGATDADIAFWTEQFRRPVSKAEAEKIEHDLMSLVEFLIEVENEG